MQVIAFSGLILFVIPIVMLEQTGGAWTPLLNRPWVWNSVLMQVLAVPAILGLSAVQEFVTRRPSGRHYCPNRGLTMLANGEPNW